ncbi:SMAD/FHA domain-containing protein [Bombardia bombarda]|uniref:SMAD/FHA domain-containing protein n=1 Tax=Bombardia bombarda TaxID=252184 RepID=A0AA39X163_9PEZI|nr:SMAD/FHA domain-containing protein [Bombardia bombarda]
MGSLEGDDRSRRRKHEDDAPESGSEQKKKTHDPDSDRKRPRHRSRSRSWDRGHRRRSRSPDSKDRRSRSKDKVRDSDRNRDGDKDRARRREEDDRRSDRRRDRDKDGERRRDRHPDEKKRLRDRDRSSSRHSQSRTEPKLLLPKGEAADSSKTDNSKRSIVKRSGPLPSQGDTFAVTTGEEPEKPVEKPNFGNSGSLAAASNSVTQADGSTVTLKYHEPPEARKPAARDQWKLFVFKGADLVDTIELSARSCWLIGRNAAVVDLAAEHPSVSSQHAALQFRYTEKRNEFGDKIGRVKPYLIDLESVNGTALNGDKVPDSRYLELRHKDMIQFGSSTREYVLMLAPRD